MNNEQKRNWAEIGANPKFKMNHIICKRCGKKLYAPIPAQCDYEEWGTYTWTNLAIAYLYSRNWKVIAPENYFVCPDCVKKTDTLKQPIGSGIIANKHYVEWIKKMREKYNFTEE